MQRPHYLAQNSAETYPLEDIRWRSDSGELLDIEYTPDFDPDRVSGRPAGLWRYREAIPVAVAAEIVSFGEGMTPLQPVQIAGQKVLFKLDYLFPSGSYKDRGATVMITQAKALGVQRVVQDSSGNAGAAVANYCALAGMDCEIFVPGDTADAKLVQIALYGARLNKVPGSREDTAAAAMEAAQTTFYASHVWNPFFFQGTKTWAYEVCEQMGWQAPDTVILPAGNGTLVLGAYIGFKELFDLGITRQIPAIVGIQAAHCPPLYEAFRQGLSTIPVFEQKPTTAEGIAIATPRRASQMLKYIRATGGRVLAVDEDEIMKSLLEMVRQGYYIEPTSAAVVEGVSQYVANFAQKDERIVSVFTGHGLKASEKLGKLGSKK